LTPSGTATSFLPTLDIIYYPLKYTA
jgi:hypothetical protein